MPVITSFIVKLEILKRIEVSNLLEEDKKIISQILKKFKKEIDNNEFEKIYKAMDSTFLRNPYTPYVGIFTEMLNDVGINPLLYMKMIPSYYARGNQIESIYIPDNIISIYTRAFENCTELKEVSLPKGLRNISSNAFYGCESLTRLTFRGTKEETANISFLGSWRNNSAIEEIECTDEIIHLG